MAGATTAIHRASLKQQNKKHNKLGHRTKGQLKAIVQGRTGSLLSVGKKAKHELSRQERRNQVKSIRAAKKEKTFNKKRSLGTELQPPFLVTVVMLSPDINPRLVFSALSKADSGATVTTSKQGNLHVSSSMFKQRFSFVLPPINDLYAMLDAVKVSSTLLVVWPSCERGENVLGEDEEKLLSAIKAQGLPTPVHAVVGFQDMAQKKKNAGYQNLLDEVNHYFPGHDKAKVYQLDKPGDPILCLRQLGSQKHRSLFFRDHRPHLMGEDVSFIDGDSSASLGTLSVSGYLRGVPLSAISLVHIPGWGDYQLENITLNGTDPHPLLVGNKKDKQMDKDDVVLYPEGDDQTTLDPIREESSDDEDSGCSEQEGDCMDDSFSSTSSRNSSRIEDVPTTKSNVPKSVNTYMTSWYTEGVNYDGSDGEDSSGDDGDEEEEDEFAALAPDEDCASTVCGDDDDDRMSIMSGSEMSVADDQYDEKVDYEDEMDEYQRIRECRDDLEFPDEMDTPRDIPARKRFQKYKALESFRTSEWDLAENLPAEYKKISAIPRFDEYRRKVLKLAVKADGANPGQYVTIHIKNVERHLYQEHLKTGSPFVVFGLLPNEHLMSVANYAIKSHSSHNRDIKSKDRLIFHVGFRRFVNQPIFSEHTAGNKQKFCRFFRPGMTVVATMYAPITYPPASVLVFRQGPSGRQDLVASGSVYNIDPDRCVLKRIILSGHPFKIHKRSVVVRYMFFDRDDIHWYKAIELRTKYGKKGKIKEPLGTHGHMKCQFNGILKSQDTILLTLYKRMFPKWFYNISVPRPSPLYSKGEFDNREEEEEEQPVKDQAKVQEKRDRMLMPPPAKKARRVHFS